MVHPVVGGMNTALYGHGEGRAEAGGSAADGRLAITGDESAVKYVAATITPCWKLPCANTIPVDGRGCHLFLAGVRFPPRRCQLIKV